VTRFEAFVDDVVRALPADRRDAVREELLDHLVTARTAAIDDGVGEAVAVERALAAMGPGPRIRHRLWVADWKRDVVGSRNRIAFSLSFATTAIASWWFVFIAGASMPDAWFGWCLLASTLVVAIGLPAGSFLSMWWPRPIPAHRVAQAIGLGLFSLGAPALAALIAPAAGFVLGGAIWIIGSFLSLAGPIGIAIREARDAGGRPLSSRDRGLLLWGLPAARLCSSTSFWVIALSMGDLGSPIVAFVTMALGLFGDILVAIAWTALALRLTPPRVDTVAAVIP
jgi:hypothetical protein